MNKAHIGCKMGLLLVATALVTTEATAGVERRGHWPTSEKTVSLSLHKAPRAQALRDLAAAAGWSIVLENVPDDPVDLEVRGQLATDVLEVLLTRGDWVATRQGALVAISPAVAPPSVAPSVSPSPPASASAGVPATLASSSAAPPPASAAAEDRFVMGSSVRIESSEEVKDLVVMGGAAEVLGTVHGDVVAFGGSVTLRPSARVLGDVAAFGATVDIQPGATVTGETAAIGASIARDGQRSTPSFSVPAPPKDDWSPSGFVASAARSIAHAAFLFVIGALLLAVGPSRMQSLELAIARRPLRALLTGVLGVVVSALVIAALAVTCVGIPIAVLAGLGLALVTLIGTCAALVTLGAALAGHKSPSPYAHLGVGCAVLSVLGMVPIVGGAFYPLVSLLGFGAVLATRCAGLVPPRGREAV